MITALKKHLRRQVWAVVLLNIAHNTGNMLREFFGRRKLFDVYVGNRDPMEEARYTMFVIDEYARAVGGQLDVKNQLMFEIGPGPFKSVALVFYAKGAEKVISYDKYGFSFDPSFERALNIAIANLLTAEERERLATLVDISSGAWKQAAGDSIIRVTGGTLHQVASKWKGKAGWVISRSVLEYMDDLPSVLQECASMLHQRGQMIHKIDLRDDGMFSLAGLDPLTFLRIPAPVYRMMISHAYRPRRWRPKQFIDYSSTYFGNVRFLVTRIIGEPKECRTWMSYPGKDDQSYMGPEDMICGAFLWARKK